MFFAFIYVKSYESTQNPGRRPLHHHEKRIQAQHILPLRKRRTPTSQGLQSKLFSLSVFGQQALIVNLPRDYPPEPEIGTACAMPTCWESATCASHPSHRCDTECNAHCQGILFFLSFVLQIGFRGCFLPETAPRQSAGYPDPRFPLSPSFVPSDRFGSFAPTGRTLPRKPRRGLEQSLKALYHSIFINFASIRGTRETRL